MSDFSSDDYDPPHYSPRRATAALCVDDLSGCGLAVIGPFRAADRRSWEVVVSCRDYRVTLAVFRPDYVKVTRYYDVDDVTFNDVFESVLDALCFLKSLIFGYSYGASLVPVRKKKLVVPDVESPC